MFWNTHPDGFPIREGDSPALVDQDQIANAETTRYFRSRIFRIPEELEDYVGVMDWMANGAAQLYSEKIQDIPDKPGEWIIWLRWIEIRGVIPDASRLARITSGKF